MVEVYPTEPRVQLDAVPKITTSGWQLPAGAARAVLLNPLASALTPTADGFDAYDGMLFVISADDIKAQLLVTSYSSTRNFADPVLASSITGNARYTVRSMRSPAGAARNYELAVTDPDKIATDTVAVAAFYQDGVTALRAPATLNPTVRPDPTERSASGSTSATPLVPTPDPLATSWHPTSRICCGQS